MKRLRTAFLTGVLVLIPLLATVDILRWFVNVVDSSARKYIPPGVLPFDFSGLGLILAIFVILSVGILATNFIGRWVIHRFDEIVKRAPIVGGLYGGIKQFLETVVNSKADKFNEAVLVEFPRPGLYSVGFRTGEPDPLLVSRKRKKLVNIFIPMTPNPTSGFYILVPPDELTPINMTVQQAFKVVVSMGVVTSEAKEKITASKAKKRKR